MINYRIYCLVALDSLALMGGNRGKLAAQAGHAYLHSWWDAIDRFRFDAQTYRDNPHARKITLAVPSVDDLIAFRDAYENVCGVSLVTDAGFTVFDKPTTTCLGIGPIRDELVGDDLKLLRPLM